MPRFPTYCDEVRSTSLHSPVPSRRTPKDLLRRQLQRVVELGPDGGLAKARSQIAAGLAGRKFRREESGGFVPESWFARLYATSDDPWDYTRSAYEQRKYALTAAALPNARYGKAYEPGCSIGKFSVMLAQRVDQLLCSDFSPDAVALARQRLRDHPHAVVERHTLPQDYPEEQFDLVVLGDLCIFLTPPRLGELLERVVGSLPPGGHLVAAHGHGLSSDIFMSGDQVHARIRRHPALRKLGGYRDNAFRLDIWERR